MTEAAAPAAAGDGDLSRIATWPNAVTAARLAALPFYVWLLFSTNHELAAGLLLGTIGATDWVDGFLARRLSQVSNLGKVIDPVADRVLVVTAVITIAVHGAVPWWFAAATLAREVLVSAAVLLLASMGAARIDVLWVGKAGTFALMTAYPWLLMADGPASWQTVLRDVAWAIGIIGLALAWMAALAYVRPARDALANGRAARRLG